MPTKQNKFFLIQVLTSKNFLRSRTSSDNTRPVQPTSVHKITGNYIT
jgi:hypothetical protein